MHSNVIIIYYLYLQGYLSTACAKYTWEQIYLSQDTEYLYSACSSSFLRLLYWDNSIHLFICNN